MVINTATRNNAGAVLIACALGCSGAHANLTSSYRDMVSTAPTLDQVKQYATNLPRSAEVISQSLYDHVVYPAAGRVFFEFFSAPVGSGQSAFSATTIPKNFADTNMEAPKALPRGVAHLVTSIELTFCPNFPNLDNAASSVDTTGQGGTVQNLGLNDPFAALVEAGFLSLIVGNESPISEASLRRFSYQTDLAIDSAYARNSATLGSSLIARLRPFSADHPFAVDPPIFIPPDQNFSVVLTYAPARATYSTGAGIIGVFLHGYRYRYSQ